MKRLALFAIYIISITAFAAGNEWARFFHAGLGGPVYNWCYDAIQAKDGNYVVTGFATGSGGLGAGLWLAKFDRNGDTVWMQTYGEGRGYCLKQTDDGGYVVLGYSVSLGAGCWLLKTDSLGDTLWTRKYDGTYNSIKWLEITSDRGFIITGSTSTLLKTDNQGNVLWTKDYDFTGRCVRQTNDGGYIVVGDGIQVLKVDSQGDSVWIKTYEPGDYQRGSFVEQTFDGGYIISGVTDAYGPSGKALWLLKLNALGDTIWTRHYGPNIWFTRNCVRQTSDGGYIVVDNSDNWPKHTWLIKTNSEGDTLWTCKHYAYGYAVDLTDDGGYVIASGFCLLKTDTNGNIGDVGVAEVDSLEGINYGDTYPVKVTVKNFGGTTEAFPARCVITFRDLEAPEIHVDTVFWGTIFVDSIAPGQTREVSFKDYNFPQKGLYWVYAATMLDGDADPRNDYASSYMGEGVVEQSTVHQPIFEALSVVGSRIVLRFPPSAKPFEIYIFDASGRKVDEFQAPQAGGTVMWGEGMGPGVYFIVPNGLNSKPAKVVLVR